MSKEIADRPYLLTAALVGALLPPDVPEGHMLRAWLDTWSGVGHVLEAMMTLVRRPSLSVALRLASGVVSVPGEPSAALGWEGGRRYALARGATSRTGHLEAGGETVKRVRTKETVVSERPKTPAPHITPEAIAKRAIARRAAAPAATRINLTLTISLSWGQAERLTARAIREGKNVDTLVGEILEAVKLSC
jgi:hypothetical protein